MTFKSVSLVVVALVIIVGVALLSRSHSSEVLANTITLGAVLPITGIAAPVGEAERNAISLAAKEINASGGVGGRPLQLIVEDDGTDATKSVTATQKLITVDHADMLIGGVWDFLANAVVPVLNFRTHGHDYAIGTPRYTRNVEPVSI